MIKLSEKAQRALIKLADRLMVYKRIQPALIKRLDTIKKITDPEIKNLMLDKTKKQLEFIKDQSRFASPANLLRLDKKFKQSRQLSDFLRRPTWQ